MARKPYRWLKSHGDDWIERALVDELMRHRAELRKAGREDVRTRYLARRLDVHESAVSAWVHKRQFPASFAAWRRLCHALDCRFEIIIKDRQGNIIFNGL